MPTFGSKTTNTDSTNRGNSTVNTTHDVGTGSNLTVLCAILQQSNLGADPQKPSAVTYNSVSLTERVTATINSADSRFDTRASIYTLDNPSTGSNTGSVTYVNEALLADTIIWFHYTDANNGVGSTTGTNSDDTGTNDTPTVTFTTDASGNVIIALASVHGGDTDPFTPATATERDDGASGTNTTLDHGFTLLELASTGGSDTISSQASVADSWVICAFELVAAAAGGAIVKDIIGSGIIPFAR